MSLAPEVRRGGGLPFGQVVSQWVCDPRYSCELRTLYTILVTYADIGARDTGRGKPYRRELAAQLAVSLSTFDRINREGQAAGLWWVEHRTDPKNPKNHDASVYHLRDGEYWRGEWTDPLKPDERAADVARREVEARRAAKRAAGITPKGGRKKRVPLTSENGGVAGGGGGGAALPARGGVPGAGRVASPVTPNNENPVDNPDREPSRPSVRKAEVTRASGSGTDGGTDGGGGNVVQEQEPAAVGGGAAPAGAGPDKTRATKPVAVTPGVELLLSIGAEVPALLLSGQTLADQGAMVTGMLVSGWSPEHVRQVIAGRPLPDPIRTTVGGVISARLRAAVAAPAPGSVPRLPAQPSGPDAGGGWAEGPAEVTPVPPSWAAQRAALEAAAAGRGPLRDCDGDGGLCPRLAVPGESMCAEHLGWELCPQCTARRVRPGRELCGRCEEDNLRPAPTDSEFAALLAEAARRAEEAERTDAHGHAAPF